METLLKDKLFLLSINQQGGKIRQRYNFNTLIFYSSLFDLASMGLLRIENGRWNILEQDTLDPVLNEVLKLILPKSGQKTQWVLASIPYRITNLFRKQVNLMLTLKLIQVQEIKFLGLKLGNRFRISKPTLIKPDFLQLERALIYGRKPDQKTLLLVFLLGVAGLHRFLFGSAELKTRAHARYKSLRKTTFENEPETYSVILKKFLENMKAS